MRLASILNGTGTLNISTSKARGQVATPDVALSRGMARLLTAFGMGACILGGATMVFALTYAWLGRVYLQQNPADGQWTPLAIQLWVAASVLFSLGIGVCGLGKAAESAHRQAR